jgi:hypothetical protein
METHLGPHTFKLSRVTSEFVFALQYPGKKVPVLMMLNLGEKRGRKLAVSAPHVLRFELSEFVTHPILLRDIRLCRSIVLYLQ